MAGLTRSEVVTWLVLFRDTKPNGLARTSQADIARRGGLSDRMVRYALAKLTAAGLVTVVRSGRLRDRASVYRVAALTKP
jgi:DNA-binding transcriptional ArsR family regulator